MTTAGEETIRLAKQRGNWATPVSPLDTVSMPAELAAALQDNKKAQAFFASLAPSYKKQYIAWIATAKRDETRRKRLNEAMVLLSRGEKLGMR